MSKMGLGPHITALVWQGGIFEETVFKASKKDTLDPHTEIVRVCGGVCVVLKSGSHKSHLLQGVFSRITEEAVTTNTGSRFVHFFPLRDLVRRPQRVACVALRARPPRVHAVACLSSAESQTSSSIACPPYLCSLWLRWEKRWPR